MDELNIKKYILQNEFNMYTLASNDFSNISNNTKSYIKYQSIICIAGPTQFQHKEHGKLITYEV